MNYHSETINLCTFLLTRRDCIKTRMPERRYSVSFVVLLLASYLSDSMALSFALGERLVLKLKARTRDKASGGRTCHFRAVPLCSDDCCTDVFVQPVVCREMQRVTAWKRRIVSARKRRLR